MKIKLREKLVSVLGIEGVDEVERYRIVDELVRLAVEKTMTDLLDEMNSEEVADLQKYIAKDPIDLPEIYKNHKDGLANFFVIFNKNLNELIREFRKNTR